MIDRTVGWLTAFACTMFVIFAWDMIFYDGRADMNAYGEGWFEVVLAGVISVAGWKRLRA